MASLYKRGKLWYVKYSLKGKTVRKSVSKDKRTALEYKAQLETQISRRRLSLPVYNYSWQDFVKKYLSYSLATKRRRTWEVEWGLMEPGQFHGIPNVKEIKRLPRYLTHEKIRKLEQVTPWHWWTMFYTMICTGMRLGEFLHLKWAQIDSDRGIISIIADQDWVPKDFETREIPIHPALAGMLRKIRTEKQDDSSYIFHNGNINKTMIRRIHLVRTWSLFTRTNQIYRRTGL